MKRILTSIIIFMMPICGMAVDGVWNYNGNDDWTTASRWVNSQIADGAGGIADFSTVDINATRTVSLAVSRTIGTILFADATNPGNDWVLQAGTNIPSAVLTLDVTSGMPVINVSNRTATITAVIDGTKGFEKRGFGTLVLAATNIFTGPVFLNGGQTTLDFNNTLSPTDNIIPGSPVLSIDGGSTLLVSGRTNTVNNQAFSSLTLGDGHNLINLVNGSTGQVNLAVGAINRQGNGFLNFNPPTNGSITTSTPNEEGMLGCYVTVRTNDWAVNNGTNTIAPYALYSTNIFFIGFNTVVAVTNVAMTNTSVNSLRFNSNPGYALTLVGTNTVTAGGIMFTTNAVAASRITGGWLTSGTNELMIIDNRKVDRRTAAANTSLDTVITDRGSTSVTVRAVSYSSAIGLVNGGLTTFSRTNNTYSGGTYLYGGGLYLYGDGSLGAVPASPRTNITAVSGFNWLKSSTAMTIHSNRMIHINTNAYLVLDAGNALTVNGVISGSGVLMGPTNYGGQAIILNGSNTMTGTIEVNSSALRAMDGIGLPTNANLRLATAGWSDGIFESTGTFTRALGTGPNQVAWGSTLPPYYNKGGFAAVGGPLTVNIGGNASNLVWGQTNFNIWNPGNHLLLGSANSTHPVTWMNPIDFGGSDRCIGVQGTAIMKGVISGYGRLLVKFNSGTLILAATNTYGGSYNGNGIEIEQGIVNVSFDEALGTVPLAPTNNIRVMWGNGVLQAGADLVLAPTRNIWLANYGASTWNCTLDSSNYVMTVPGVIHGQGGMTKAGSGKVVLLGANCYWGLTTITNGDLVVNGSLSLDSSVIVTNIGFLGGTGIVGGPVTVYSGSGLVPGGITNGGTLTINNTLTMKSGSIYNWRYDSSPGLVTVLNQVTFTPGSSYKLRIYNPNGLAEPANQSFTIMTWPDSVADPDTNVFWTVEKPAGGGADSWSVPVVTMDTVNNRILLTFRPIGFPTVDNGIGPSSIMTNTAVLNGNYTSTGATAEVYIYWGTSDGGTNKDNWANVIAMGETSFGTFSNAVTSLYYGLRYYYRCYATNATGECWSPVTSSFITLQPRNYTSGLRGSVFLSVSSGSAALNLSDAYYVLSSMRVFTGSKSGTVLAMTEAPQWNVTSTGEISGFGMFPGYDSAVLAPSVVAFSGQLVPRVSGVHNFRWDCDDLGMMYIDLNDDGIFQAGEGVVGAPAWAANGNVTLTANQSHNFIFIAWNGGGPGTLNYYVTEPGQSEVRVNTILQGGMWVCGSGAGISNSLPSSIGTDSAMFNATLSSSGAVSEVWAYWGLVDCTNVASAWANSAYVGSFTDVVSAVNYTPTGLTPDTRYYVRFRITNQLMDAWSDYQVFNTTFLPSVYPYKTKITFSGYNKDETLTNFPALVVLSESITNFYYSQFASIAGTDLRFTDESGANELGYEIEKWNPSGGLALWLKADAGVVTNNYGSVINWLDQSGQKRNVDNVSGNPGFNTNGPSGKPVVTLDGNSYLYTTYNFDSLNEYTILSVARYTGTNMYNRVLSSFTRNWLFGFHSNGDEKFYAEGWIQNTGATNTNWHIHAGTINSNPDPQANFWRDGNQLAANNVGSHNVNYKPGRLELGGYNGASEMSKCEVAEILIYDHVLNTVELNQVGCYLEEKYGLTTGYTPPGYSPTSGQSYVWVKVPEFTNNCAVWAYWGNPNAIFTNAYTTNGSVWSEGYLGVWHMQSTNVTDSTSNRYNIAGWTYTTNANGAIGMGQGFNGSNAYVGVGNIRVASDISVEAWAYSTNVNQNGIILGKNPVNSQWQLFSEGGSLKWRATLGDVTLAAPSGSNWHYLAGLQSGTEASLYVDGEFGSSGTIGVIDDGSGNVEIGRYNPGYYFNGALDEIRLSSVIRSSNWLWASFMNQASNSIFAGFGTPITISSSSASNITTTSAVLNATLAAPGSFGDVWAFWGMSDGGTNPADWASSNFVGSYPDVLSTNISCTVTGLLPDASYYFTFLATNTQDVVWAKPSRTLRSLFSPSVYPYKMKVTFSGYTATETLTNFPALVTFGENLPGLLYRQFRTGATDLRFTDESETTELNYEIDSWNTNGSSYVWVQVPTFTSNCSVWAYWGYTNATVAPAYTTNGATWDSNYRSVFHLHGSTGVHYDSSLNHNVGGTNGVITRNAEGKIDGADYFYGKDGDDYVEIYNSASLENVQENDYTLEAWFKPMSVPAGTDNNNLGYGILEKNGYHVGLCYWNNRKFVADNWSSVNGYYGLTSINSFDPGSFYHVVEVLDRTAGIVRMYVNGQYQGQITFAPGMTLRECGAVTWKIGIAAPGSGSYRYASDGTIDEVRISGITRSYNWIWANWLNQSSNSFFNTYYPFAGIKNVSASGITTTSAVLNATLYASNATLDVSVCWDTNNWGTNITFWANTNYVGSWTNVDFTNISCTVTGLVSDTRYYYKFSATNAVNSLQAPDVLDFKTLFSPSLLATYPYRMQITFSGYTPTNEVLTNFPALVVLNQGTNGFAYNQLKPTGADLRFVDEATNELNYEIESWNTNGSSYVWVQVLQLTNNCSIWAYWGNTNAPVPVYLTNGAAWNSNFMGVWHLHTNAWDSTANRYHGTVWGGANSIPVAGLIGNAWNFDGVDNAIRVTRMIQDDFTIAFWMKAGANSAGGAQWYNGTGLIDTYVTAQSNDFGVSYNNQQATFGTGGPDTNLSSGAVYINDMNWRYVVATRVKSTGLKKIYVDGVDCGTQVGGVNSLDWSSTLAFGQIQTNSANYLNGRLDEIEISNIDRSSNWIWACYMNQVSNSVFNPAGSVEGGFQPSINNHNGASGVMLNSANLNGFLMSTGGALTAVSVYWGTTDGSTNKAIWANTNDFVVTGAGLLTTNVTGLACAAKYYYRFYASNSYGECWAPSSASFAPSRYRMKVQFGGYDKDETLTNFPALVVFSEGSSGFSYGQCTTTNGSDLRFANSNETVVLNHEIEKWDPNGSSYVWVQVPELVSNGWIWACWGGSDTNPPAYSTNGATWSQNYLSVWHFNSMNASYKYPDSTSHRFDGLNFGCSSVQGQMGGAVDIGVAPKYIDIAGIGSSAGSYTFHYWLKTSTPSGDGRMTDIYGGAGSRVLTSMQSGRVRYYDTTWRDPVGWYLNNGAWRHVVFALDGRPGVTNASIYVDGVLASNGIQYIAQNLAGNAKIGCEQGNPSSTHFDGAMDEFQISTIPRSSNWIWACYRNQGLNSLFNTPVPVESTTLPVINNNGGVTNVTMNSACINGYLTSTGSTPTVVSVYWGETDGGTNKLAWGNVIDFGTTDIGPLTTNITGLSVVSTYYYRYYASNSYGECWAPYSTVFSPVKYQMKITFTGYDRPETLTNFPALVVFSEGSNGFSYSQCATTNGAELRFANSDGTMMLNHEVEKWNTNGNSYVWVQVPELTNNAAIWVYWGSSGVDLPVCNIDGSAWDSSFRAVWHMGEANARDSTANANNGTGIGNTTSNGWIGDAQSFNGSSTHIECSSKADSLNLRTNITISAWLYHNTGIGWSFAYGAGDTSSNVLTYTFGVSDANSRWATEFNGTAALYGQQSIPEAKSWHHQVYVYDYAANMVYLYHDGVLTTSGARSGLIRSSDLFKIGCKHDMGCRWNGYIDELRVDTTPRSSNWIWACYMNQASNSAFMSSTFLVSNTGASNVTANSAELNGYLHHDDGVTTYAKVYYGQTDGGSIAANWEFIDDRDVVYPGSLTASIGSLEADKNYYYRYYVSNSVRFAWAAPSAQFFTGQAIIQTTDSSASEMGPDTGMFTVYRPESATNASWIVNYVLGGTAVNGVDYSALSGSVLIPAGQTNATITVTPIEDLLIESDETVTATLTSGGYIIGSQSNAVVTIHDTLHNTWPYRLKITFPGYLNPEAATLTNFPALVVFSTNITNFVYSTFASPANGGDLRFGNSNETTMLNYEIEQWNTGGSSYVWVQVPELVDSNTCIWAYWGNKMVTVAPSYTMNGATWASGYAGVWHMNESSNTNSAFDSTAAKNNGTQLNSPPVTNGLIAGGRSLNGTHTFTVGSTLDLRSKAFTIDVWANMSTLYASGDNMWAGGGVGANYYGLHCGGRSPGLYFGLYADDLSYGTDCMGDRGSWHYYSMVMSGTHVKTMYRDGVLLPAGGGNNSFYLSSGLVIGGTAGGGASYKGYLDEMRVSSSIARSSNWVWACYMNQASNNAFNIYGDIQKLLKGTVIIIR